LIVEYNFINFCTFILAFIPPSPSIYTRPALGANLKLVTFFALFYGANYSCCGGNQAKQSTRIIANGVWMMLLYLVGASSSHRPWYGPKPLDTMVSIQHGTSFAWAINLMFFLLNFPRASG
jgi:hypothetical protein